IGPRNILGDHRRPKTAGRASPWLPRASPSDFPQSNGWLNLRPAGVYELSTPIHTKIPDRACCRSKPFVRLTCNASFCRAHPVGGRSASFLKFGSIIHPVRIHAGFAVLLPMLKTENTVLLDGTRLSNRRARRYCRDRE